MISLSELLQSMMQRAGIGTLTLSKLTGIPRSSIENWREGTAQRPKHWRPLLQIARVLSLSVTEVETLLTAAGYPALATLGRDLCVDDPDWPHLQPWLPTPTTGAVPPLTSAWHQLRPPIADFVDRDAEVDQVVRTMRTALVAGRGAIICGVQGMGGIGKTELAYVVAHRLHDVFPDAQIVLNLRGTSIAPLAPPQALQAVIHTFAPDAKLTDDLDLLQQHYQSILHGQRVLLLADDARDAAQVRPLLPPTSCALLITSRTRFTLPGMTTINLEQLPSQSASTLLRTICPRLSEAEAQALARTCGYLPLALRVTGGLLHTTPALTIADYLTKLADAQQRLSLLRDPDDSQLDVAASLALSYAQLDPATQQLFRQLGVFVADFPTALAQDVVEIGEKVNIETLLHVLLRRNLIMHDAERVRWRLHDLLRDLAWHTLVAAGELEKTMWRYTQAVVQIAQAIHDEYHAGNIVVALSHFDVERPHIDAGRRWAAAYSGTVPGDTLLLAYALATSDTGNIRYDVQHERILQLELALAAAQNLGNSRGVIRVCIGLGSAYTTTGEIRRAIRCYEQALTLARALADQYLEAMTLNNLGTSYWKLGISQQAIVCLEQMLTIAQPLADRRLEGMALHNLGLAAGALGSASQALTYHEQALNIARAMGERHGEGIVLSELGQTYLVLGNPWRTIETCTQALDIIHEVGDRREEAHILTSLGVAYAMLGKTKDALNLFEQAHAIFRLLGHREGEARCSWHYGLALVSRGEDKRALPLLRVTVAYEQKIGHAKATEHAVLLARLEAGEGLPVGHAVPLAQRALGDDADESTENDIPP